MKDWEPIGSETKPFSGVFNGEKAENLNARTIVTIYDSVENYSKIKIADKVELSGKLLSPIKAKNPSQFDYGNYLRNHGTYAVFYAKDYQVLESTPTAIQKFMQGVNNFREEIIAVHSNYLKSPNLEILGGIVFGDDAVSPPQVIKQSFINSGLLHILAASGMNVAFIYSFFYFLMSLFGVNFKFKVCLGIVTVLIYALMTGLGASVIRAACMLIFVLIGKLIDRDAHSISLLSFVALLMLLYNPLYINDVGFQLSFIVTFGILVSAPIIGKLPNRIADFLLGTVSIPIIAQLWVIPVQIFYFNNISLYSVFANIMSVPILMVLSFGGFISSLLAGIPPISHFICRTFDIVLNPLITLLVNISDFWGKLPHSTLQTTHPSVFQIIIYYGILLCITGLLYKEFNGKRILKPTLAILIIILGFTLIPIKNHNLEITAFDVGNADCFLIKTPENKYLMIDTARSGYRGGKSQAEIIVLKYLKDKGIKNLDSIIVTHFDNDHCGGAVSLMNGLNVSKIYVNDKEHTSYAAKDIYNTALKTKTNLLEANENQEVYNYNGLTIRNFISNKSKNDNDNSILTLLEYQGFKMLFTGDASAEAILANTNITGKIDVLKVPHHGAAGGVNKELITKFNPDFSVISVGENKFGHPNLYTLKLLQSSKILRTDIDNAILFRVNKRGYDVLTYNIKKRKFNKINSKTIKRPQYTGS